MKYLIPLLITISLFSCQEKPDKFIDSKDYNPYLFTNNTPTKDALQHDFEFWQFRFNDDSTRLMEMSKMSAIHAALFGITGSISELKLSESLSIKSIEVAARNKDAYLRSLARNYISQHRFKEAKIILDSAYTYSDNRNETEMMLFDVAMELGDYNAADTLLRNIKDLKDPNYLIRLSKWSDYNGNLDAAIKYMEQVKEIAENRDNKSLKIWVYSNIGDYYGHAGRLKDSYNSYLKTLTLEPDNSYAKKQIAWMIYSSEQNIEEANRIIDSIMVNHHAPDYYLLKGEMAEYMGNKADSEKYYKKFLEAANDDNYGGMYNTYLIELYADSDSTKALNLAKKEVGNRATPETYHLLALAQLKAGDKINALKTINNHVIDKTFEPSALYNAALVYKANGMEDKVRPLKKVLLGASYELGPLMANEVENL